MRMEESGRLAALQLELDTKAAAVRQLRDELASKDEELEFLREELHTKTEELEEVRILVSFIFIWNALPVWKLPYLLKVKYCREHGNKLTQGRLDYN